MTKSSNTKRGRAAKRAEERRAARRAAERRARVRRFILDVAVKVMAEYMTAHHWW